MPRHLLASTSDGNDYVHYAINKPGDPSGLGPILGQPISVSFLIRGAASNVSGRRRSANGMYRLEKQGIAGPPSAGQITTVREPSSYRRRRMSQMASFILEISYAQLAVFDASLADPLNDRTGAHALQGFSWRPGSVSFRMLDGAGGIAVQVFRSRTLDVANSRAHRVIALPFTVPVSGENEIASVTSGVSLELPAGEDELTCDHGLTDNSGMWANLYFERALGVVAPRIIRADAALNPPAALVMIAKPA
jgi:hypothetical protein